MAITNRDLFEILRSKMTEMNAATINAVDILFDFVRSKMGSKWKNEDEAFEASLRKKLSGFGSTLNAKWKACKSTEQAFKKKEDSWLNRIFSMPEIEARRSSDSDESQLSSDGKRGRKFKNFYDLSDRSKLRRTEEIRRSSSPEELLFSASSELYKRGERVLANVISDISRFPQSELVTVKKFLRQPKLEIGTTATPEKAVDLLIQTRDSKDQYKQHRKFALQNGSTVYPPYYKVLEAKKRCYPEGVEVNYLGKYF